ncbi:MAG: GatB/YqeY domain-containing protein [Saprospiraceae bacterium]
MSLESRLNDDLKTAMRAKDQASLRTIRAIKTALTLLKTDGSGSEINEEAEIKLLQKLAKQRKDSLDIYDKQGREDLAVKEREEIAVLEKYLPAQMDEAELENFLKGLVTQTGASGMGDMGKVMGMASKQLAGKADGKTISGIVRKLLA